MDSAMSSIPAIVFGVRFFMALTVLNNTCSKQVSYKHIAIIVQIWRVREVIRQRKPRSMDIGHRYHVVLQSMVTANELIASLIASQVWNTCAIVARISIELLDRHGPRHGPRLQGSKLRGFRGSQAVRASSPQLNRPFFGLGAICRFTLDSTTPADLPCRRSVGCSSQSAFCSSSRHKARSPLALGTSQGKSRSECLGES